MEQRISLITLGARDIEALATFCKALGRQSVDSPEGVVAVDLGEPVDRPGAGTVTPGYNLRQKAQVSEVPDRAEAAGADILRPAQDVFRGGHHGYFADPKAHIREVAHNPFNPLGPDGAFQWNGAG